MRSVRGSAAGTLLLILVILVFLFLVYLYITNGIATFFSNLHLIERAHFIGAGSLA